MNHSSIETLRDLEMMGTGEIHVNPRQGTVKVTSGKFKGRIFTLPKNEAQLEQIFTLFQNAFASNEKISKEAFHALLIVSGSVAANPMMGAVSIHKKIDAIYSEVFTGDVRLSKESAASLAELIIYANLQEQKTLQKIFEEFEEVVFASQEKPEVARNEVQDTLAANIKRFTTITAEGTSVTVVEQFSKDIERAGRFIVKNLSHPTPTDSTVYPPPSDRQELRIKDAYHALLEKVGADPADQKWMNICQAVVSQTTRNGLFLAQKTEVAKLAGEVAATGHLAFFLVDHNSPITLELVRNEANQITGIKVTLKESFDIKRGENSKQTALFQENAFEGTLEYTVKFDKDNKPVVSDFSTSFEEV